MQKQYEAPELTLIGEADEMILGFSIPGADGLGNGAPDFEFEQD
jgi:hypothetical protein